MYKIISIVILILSLNVNIHAQVRNVVKKKTQNNTDSVQISVLTKNFLGWRKRDRSEDFPLIHTDSVYTGINLPKHKKRMEELSKTGSFTKTFLKNYNDIALRLDSELKYDAIRYYVGSLPPYGNGANEWCNCQDYPSADLDNLQITDLLIKNDTARYIWKWETLTYSIKAVKEKRKWMFSQLERFDVKYFKFQ